MDTANILRVMTLLVFSFALVGCVPEKQSLRTEKNWAGLVENTNTSIVVGRIEWLEKGEPRKIGTGLIEFSVSLGNVEDRFCH